MKNFFFNNYLIAVNNYTLGIGFFLFFIFFLFLTSLFGILINKRNLIIVLLFLELLLLFVNYNFILFSLILDNATGLFIAIYIIMIAGAEVSIGLAFVILIFRIKGILNLNFLISLKG